MMTTLYVYIDPRFLALFELALFEHDDNKSEKEALVIDRKEEDNVIVLKCFGYDDVRIVFYEDNNGCFGDDDVRIFCYEDNDGDKVDDKVDDGCVNAEYTM
jgi:hypothetical protein